MNQIFRGFCINRFGLGPLHYISSHSDFGFEFAEIFVFEKRLPVSVSRGVYKIAYKYNYFQTFKYNFDSKLHPWLICGQNDTLKACFNRLKYWKSKLNWFFFKWRLSVSPIIGVVNSPTQQFGESATLHINDTRSRRLPDSTIHGFGDSPYHWCGESTTLSIIDTECADQPCIFLGRWWSPTAWLNFL
jgi:hypothetical protein